jgi:tetratricopeptide (TPR) repeat protein
MHEEHKRKEERELIIKFESFLKNNESHYFEEEQFFHIIDYYRDREKFRAALKACDIALAQFPYSTDLIAEKADILVKLNEAGQALEMIEEALTFSPNDPELLIQKGNIHILQSEYLKAVHAFEVAVDFMGEDKDEIYYSIGLAYQGLNDFTNAVVAYKNALEFNVNNENVLYELAYCLDVNGELENSLVYYDKFIEQDPYSEYAWYNIGIVYNKLGQFDKAIEAYEFAVAIDEDFSSAYFNMGNSFMNLEQFTKALNAYQRTYDLEGASAEIFCNIGAAYEKLSQFDLAIKYYQKAGKLDNLYHEAWYGVGTVLSLQDRWYEAIHFLTKAVKIDPNNPVYIKSLAEAEYKVGNVVSARELFRHLRTLDTDDLDYWLDWSYLYYDQGDYENALSIMEGALEETPDHAPFMYRKVVYLISMGKYKEAFNNLEVALILDFEGHTQLFDFFDNLNTQKALFKIIDQYRKTKG